MGNKFRRLFIALPIVDTAIPALSGISGFLDKNRSSLKIVPPGNYHLTLKFFGSLEPEICTSIINAFISLEPLKKINYKIQGLGVFPASGDPSVIWAGLECDKQPLNEILKSVDAFSSSFGFPPEKRDFIPHLTLARVKKDRTVNSDFKRFLQVEKNTLFSSSVFDELVLFESILKPDGAEYKKIEVLKLI